MASISIVMAYYNRQKQFDKTLQSIEQSVVKDYELIMVDDASEPPLVCDKAQIIRIEPKDKWYNSTVIPNNMGLRAATSDIIVIQGPECYHIGDVLNYVQENIRPGLYLSFAAYALNPQEGANFLAGQMPELRNGVYDHPWDNGWYNHSVHRPVGYHFCSAIMREDLDRFGGFDERYAKGICYEDDDFIRKVKRSGLRVRIVDDPYVIHQYHPQYTYMKPGYMALHDINKRLFDSER